jgi:signal transduction histidine kinase
MPLRRKFNRIEWGLLAFLAAACAMLTSLQYQWTGEIAQAEAGRLRTNLEEQSQLLCRAFDAELSSNCRQFFVTRSEVEDLGRDAACLQRLREWLANGPRPMFRRIALASTDDGKTDLLSVDTAAQKLAPMDWPEHWATLKETLESRGKRDRKSYPSFSSSSPSSFTHVDPGGALFYFEQPTPRDYDGQWEGTWIVFELDVDYIRDTWLPELVGAYLSPADRPPNDVTVKTASEPVTTIFSNHAVAEDDDGRAPFTMHFNKQVRSFSYARPLTGEGRWILESRYRPGALEAVVDGSRQRNLGVALAINALILLVGVALVRHTRRSRALAEAQMNFVTNVSHELRTPLTVIRGAAHNLEHGVVSERDRIADYAVLIQTHAENLGDMVEQILSLAAARRRKESKREPVAMMDVLARSVAACSPETNAAGCKVVLEAPEGLPEVQGDPAALDRVFQNLISNAAKHAAAGRWIGISVAAMNGTEPPMVEVKVSDKGPGIPKEEQAAVFEPFVRGNSAREAQKRGSGLGLSLVREIVKQHGGSVRLASEPGQGATFTVRIPTA